MTERDRHEGEGQQTGREARPSERGHTDRARRGPTRSSRGHRSDYGDPVGQAGPVPGALSVQWMRLWMTGLTTLPGWAAM